jgi:ribosome-binding factor A
MDRMARVNSLVKETIADIIFTKTKDPRIGMISIHDVKVSKDLRTAKVFYGVVNPLDKEQTQKGLEKAAAFIQKELGRQVELRFTPKLTFIFDDSYDKSDRIFRLLRSIKN